MKTPLICFAALLFSSASALALTDDEKIAKGEIILTTTAQEGSDVPLIAITAVIDTTPELVWKLIDKCADYKKVMPRMSESEELSRDGNKVRCRTKIAAPWPVKDLEAVTLATHTVEPGKSWVRSWTLESGTFDRNEGSWTLTPYGDGTKTLVVYKAATQPHSSVPGFIRKMAQKSALPDIIHNMRKALVKEG